MTRKGTSEVNWIHGLLTVIGACWVHGSVQAQTVPTDLLDLSIEELFDANVVTEADLAEGKLSSESPIGAALLGGKVNQIVSVPAQKGRPRKYKITKIDAA